MDFHLNDEEFEQLLQSLDDIPPGNLPQDGIYPFNFPEAYPSVPTFVDGDPLNASKGGSTGDREMQTEELKAQVEELKKQNEVFMSLVKDLRTYLYGVQTWMEQVSVVLQQRLGESIESAAELASEA
ncbi:uncharacterized protein BDV17DRAFT_290705 [Aspergillus undulatus]|uniref:uncharacterized protein n=1 Tax=Aspergillus undulatus TaxID=1810928 RepID=UPI003CCE0353